VIKLAYGHVEFQNFSGRTPDPVTRGEERGRTRKGTRGGEERGRQEGQGNCASPKTKILDPSPLVFNSIATVILSSWLINCTEISRLCLAKSYSTF
jgi:hypothetical protein